MLPLNSTATLNFFTATTTPTPPPTTRGPFLSARVSLSSRRNLSIIASSTTPVTNNQTSSSLVKVTDSASDVVFNFYNGINARDLGSVENLIAENCVYEDLIFPNPFTGREAIMEFFNKFTDTITEELQFVIDDISTEDSSVVAVTWHLEWKGKTFPFSRGCSFYRLEVVDGKRLIIYGRDSVEPFLKPGESALTAIGGVTWLLRQFPQLADML